MGRLGRAFFARGIALAVALTVSAPARAAAPEADSGFSSELAAEMYASGLKKFDDGDFEDALEDLDASLRIEMTAAALYAKAQSLNKLERCREAVPIYNRVLEMVPEDSPAQSAVKDALVTCAEKMATEEAPPTSVGAEEPDEDERLDDGPDEEPTDIAPPPRKTKHWYADPYAPVMAGLGIVGLGVGGYFLGQASKENKEQPDRYDEFEAKADRVQALRIRGGVITGIGGALFLGGVIRYAVLGVRERKAVSIGPVLSPRWTGLTIRGRF